MANWRRLGMVLHGTLLREATYVTDKVIPLLKHHTMEAYRKVDVIFTPQSGERTLGIPLDRRLGRFQSQ
jgi:hypothetical protein